MRNSLSIEAFCQGSFVEESAMLERIVSSAHATLVPVALALSIAACASPTPYQPLERRGAASGGYSEQRIEDNRFRVTFSGNQFTRRDRVENYLLYRAAELTLQAGYDGFTIVQRDTERDVDTRVVPSGFGPGAYGYWRPYWRYYGRFGWRHWDPWFGDPFWADTMDVRTVERYEASAEIVMFRGRRPDDPRSFDARQVMDNLASTIQLPR
jgi:hypothetical protein